MGGCDSREQSLDAVLPRTAYGGIVVSDGMGNEMSSDEDKTTVDRNRTNSSAGNGRKKKKPSSSGKSKSRSDGKGSVSPNPIIPPIPEEPSSLRERGISASYATPKRIVKNVPRKKAAKYESPGRSSSPSGNHLSVQTRRLQLGDPNSPSESDMANTPSPNPFNGSFDRTISLPPYTDEDIERLKNLQPQQQARKNSIAQYVLSERRVQEIQLDLKSQKKSMAGTLNQNVMLLPRGGTYVKTSIGPIQFGLPPETIKDSMQLGLQLPSYYVLPKERFNVQTGINVAEFEFPAYFNFFVLRKRINIITTREVEPLIRTIFQETLLGPKEVNWPEVYSSKVPREAYPDLAKEMGHFRKNPFDPSTELTVDTLLQFTYFEDGVAMVDESVRILDEGDEYVVMDKGKKIAKVSCFVVVSAPTAVLTSPQKKKSIIGTPMRDDLKTAEESQGRPASMTMSRSRSNTYIDKKRSEDFDVGTIGGGDDSIAFFVPPAFGITMLGNSHGFDPTGTTTGFVLWMNRRGIMVDPPPHSGSILKHHGIPSRLIQGMVLTHCHADHDAGTFQKILEEGRITLYTTDVIKNSFMRKYSAISGLEEEFLDKLFEFRPVTIGERISVYGGELEFHYSLHSIPCVGFSAYCNGKSMVYSGDSFNDRDGIQAMFEKGVMTAERRDQLINFPWHHSCILHEAGVPPIHTPVSTLTALPEDVKERLYVVHVSKKDIPSDSGLKTAEVGPDNTIVIDRTLTSQFKALEILELVATIDLFQGFPIDRSVEILQFARIKRYSADDVLISQGTVGGDKMYVVVMGVVSVYVNETLVKNLTVGDHFGEMSIVTKLPRTATIIASTDIEVIEFSGHEFMHMVRDTNAIERLRHLGLMQREESWQAICQNSVLCKMSSSQKTYLQSILHKKDAQRGEVLWETGEKGKVAIINDSALFVFQRAKHMTPFGRGAFIGDMQALLYGKPLQTTLVCGKPGSFFYIKQKNLLKFFEDNPGVLVYFKDRRFVE